MHLLVADLARRLDELEDRLDLEGVGHLVAVPPHPREVRPAAAGHVRGRAGVVGPERPEQVGVDPGRVEEFLPDGPIRIRGEGVGVLVVAGDGLAGQREPVRVDPRGGPADDGVARLGRAGKEGVLWGKPRTGARDVQPADDLGHDGRLAADEGDAGPLGPPAEPFADLLGCLVVGLLHREVVHERDRFDALCDEVVDVHRDAVDPDRRVVVDGFGDEQLRPHPVGGEGEHAVADVDQPGELALELAGSADQCCGGDLALRDVHARRGVREPLLGLIGHVRGGARCQQKLTVCGPGYCPIDPARPRAAWGRLTSKPPPAPEPMP